MKTVSAVLLASLLLGGCLSKVPPDQRKNDPWRQTSEQLSRPTTLN